MPKVLYKVNYGIMNELSYSLYKGYIEITSEEDR